MTEEQVIEKLKNIIYPELEKNIVVLKFIDSMHVKSKSLHVRIDTDNKQAFNFTAREIPKMFKDDFRDIEVERKVEKVEKVIVITSNKGGVGKSIVSANFAIALAEKGYKVGLFDANTYNPSMLKLFDIKNREVQKSENNKIIPYESFNIKIVSIESKNKSNNISLIQFLKSVEWGELDFLVIDMPSQNMKLNRIEKLPLYGTILVTTPQTLICDTLNHFIMELNTLHVKILGVIENMSYFITPDTNKRYDIFGKDGAKKIYEKHSLHLLGQIPLDMNIKNTLSDKKIKSYYKAILEEVLTLF